ncbi:hypothetical protein [Flavobacterium sp. B183]|uniref:hypothetical protein n=1 Tax=Flavobacterium sp. B183 TaxID=907046 RepID=UPI00201F4E3F|nr:hypothetical protein [Flavobacterium sp. B183]URC13968.1 hypothetical protein M4I44_06100 [Flavobacterium sp. B183]URC14011.1 hypothetical protein M4I44_06380 [Flavobacterium sp. B183]
MMTFYTSSNLLIIKDDLSKIVKAYSGAIAKMIWQDETNNKQTPKLQTMTVSKQWLENKIKDLNDWLFDNEKHSDFALNRHRRDYYVRKIIDLEERKLTSIEV